MMTGSWDALARRAAPFLRPLLIAIAAWLLLFIDPLGMEDATAERSAAAAQRMAATLYRSSNRVTVVLIDQQYIEADPHRTWPLKYREQGALLRRIALAGRPEAIFVDLLYKNPHEVKSPGARTRYAASDALAHDNPADLLGPIARSSVPVYIAGLPYADSTLVGLKDWNCEDSRRVLADPGSILDPIHNHALITSIDAKGRPIERVAMVSWSGCGDRYPLMLGGSDFAKTPAFALYRTYCERANAPREVTGQRLCKSLDRVSLEPMMVRWGAFTSGMQQRFYRAGVCQSRADPQSWPSRAGALIRQYLISIIDSDHSHTGLDDRMPCPAVNVITASALMSMSAMDLGTALQGQFVLVGAQISGVPDSIVSPVHGQVPGVVWHAMALDNLLELGDGYLTQIAEPDWLAIELAVLIAIALVTATRFPRWLSRWNPEPYYPLLCILTWVGCALFASLYLDDRERALQLAGLGTATTLLAPRETGRVLGLFTLICGVAVLVMHVLHWEPRNWMALALAGVGVNQIVKSSLSDTGAPT
jgi:CHASE2 domain-containing sensor protein